MILVLADKLLKWYTMPNIWLDINWWKSENANMTQNSPSSPKCIYWLQVHRQFKKSPRSLSLRGINYQMEYILWAQHIHKNSPRLQGGSQLRPTLYLLSSPCILHIHMGSFLWLACIIVQTDHRALFKLYSGLDRLNTVFQIYVIVHNLILRAILPLHTSWGLGLGLGLGLVNN